MNGAISFGRDAFGESTLKLLTVGMIGGRIHWSVMLIDAVVHHEQIVGNRLT